MCELMPMVKLRKLSKLEAGAPICSQLMLLNMVALLCNNRLKISTAHKIKSVLVYNERTTRKINISPYYF